MPDFSAIIIAKNEEHNLERLMKTLEGVDDIVLVDDGSTDGTADLASTLGARVFKVGDRFTCDVPSQHDIEKFEQMFTWKPHFTEENTFFQCGAARNHAAAQAKHDWVYNPDADEFTEWDLEKLKHDMKNVDQIRYRMKLFNTEYYVGKLYRRSKMEFRGNMHEIPYSKTDKPVKSKETEHMWVLHDQTYSPLRMGSLYSISAMEYEAIKHPSQRGLLYLGREYINHEEYEKSIPVLKWFLRECQYVPEASQAMFLISHAYWKLGDLINCKNALVQSVGINPNNKVALESLADITVGEESEAWARYASTATNHGSMFIRTGDDKKGVANGC